MGRLNLIERRLERFMREPTSVRNAAGVIVVVTTLIVVGAGVMTDVLARVARAMLADDRYRANAHRLQRVYAATDGPGAAADAILELARSDVRTDEAEAVARSG
jgi:hypothetical protein